VATGKEKGKFFNLGTANTVAFHPHNTLIAVGDDSGKIHLVHVETMREIGQLKHVPPPGAITGSSVEAVAFGKNGKFLASASADKTVTLWNLANGQALAVLPHPSYVRSLALSPDGATLASGCADSIVRLWNLAKKETTATFEGHKTAVTALAFHPDGKTLASGSMDGLVKLWKVASGENPSDVVTNARNISLAFSADGKRFATGGELRGVLVVDPETGNTLLTLPAASGPDHSPLPLEGVKAGRRVSERAELFGSGS
jgi:WD40 repeat protein